MEDDRSLCSFFNLLEVNGKSVWSGKLLYLSEKSCDNSARDFKRPSKEYQNTLREIFKIRLFPQFPINSPLTPSFHFLLQNMTRSKQ
jgi:hypothetical protein